MYEAFISVKDLQTTREVQNTQIERLSEAEITLDNTPEQVHQAEAKFEYALYRIDKHDNKYLRSVFTRIFHGRPNSM